VTSETIELYFDVSQYEKLGFANTPLERQCMHRSLFRDLHSNLLVKTIRVEALSAVMDADCKERSIPALLRGERLSAHLDASLSSFIGTQG
jgi:hypothetical protein